MKNPWTKLKQKVIYDNKWITVEEHDVLNPKGGAGIYGKVHFKNKALGIIPLDEKHHTWLVGQYRYTLDEYSWEIPMGGGPIEEDILMSAQRELKEETGLTANKWTPIMRIHTSNSVTDEEGFLYLAEELTKGAPEEEDTEDLKIWRLAFADAVKMVMDNRITDSLSQAGILKVARMLNY